MNSKTDLLLIITIEQVVAAITLFTDLHSSRAQIPVPFSPKYYSVLGDGFEL